MCFLFMNSQPVGVDVSSMNDQGVLAHIHRHSYLKAKLRYCPFPGFFVLAAAAVPRAFKFFAADLSVDRSGEYDNEQETCEGRHFGGMT